MFPINDSQTEWISSEEFGSSERALSLPEYADEDPYFPDPYSRF
jgi:hypothetical protein